VSYQQQLRKMGATPGKLALVGVLSLILIAVIAMQMPASVADVPLGRTSTSKSPKIRGIRNDTAAQTEASTIETKTHAWPKVDLAATLAIDPFAKPSWTRKQVLKPSESKSTPSILAELRKQGASIVVIAADGKSAKIGDQNVYIGDILEGYQVTYITTQGVLLNKFEPRY